VVSAYLAPVSLFPLYKTCPVVFNAIASAAKNLIILHFTIFSLQDTKKV
jgi:hypothetical protein